MCNIITLRTRDTKLYLTPINYTTENITQKFHLFVPLAVLKQLHMNLKNVYMESHPQQSMAAAKINKQLNVAEALRTVLLDGGGAAQKSKVETHQYQDRL